MYLFDGNTIWLNFELVFHFRPTSCCCHFHPECVRIRPSAVWQDWAIYWTLGKFLKPLSTINLPKSPTFLGNFCKGVKIIHFSSEIIFGQLFLTFGNFFWSHWYQTTNKYKLCTIYYLWCPTVLTFGLSKQANAQLT